MTWAHIGAQAGTHFGTNKMHKKTELKGNLGKLKCSIIEIIMKEIRLLSG